MQDGIANENGLSPSTEDDRNASPRQGISISLPAEEARCECCQRHVSDLPPFEDWVLRYGCVSQRLVPVWVRMGPVNEEAEHVFSQFFAPDSSEADRKDALARMIKELGAEKAVSICAAAELANTAEALWLCRDCHALRADDIRATRARFYRKRYGLDACLS